MSILFGLKTGCDTLPLLKFGLLLSFISELMVTSLDDRMVNTHNMRGEAESSQMNGPNPPPPLTLAQAIASILESRDEQTELLRQFVANSSCGGNGARNTLAPAPSTYREFTTTHPPIFTKAGEPLEANHWPRVIEPMFLLLRCMEHQKTLFAMQQLWGDASAWWANYTAAHPTDYQVPRAEFRSGLSSAVPCAPITS
jgi:hypothetical protein